MGTFINRVVLKYGPPVGPWIGAAAAHVPMKSRPAFATIDVMKAIVQDKYGSPDDLALREVDKPAPADGEVLVRVHAASINARDWHIMRGDPYLARLAMRSVFGPSGPKRQIRGSDVAGRVEAVGRG
ncbi:hypothetical protein Pflav_072400 [Phytohabitans flavus]|uniref:Alcohol dehydrogenase-like N-terminal domain-containing protein n=1 Tax=Phytohabitans flavus TaxID=1076124 RepID=A0A6F8Y445_9ACTN|nr:hypothetical protein Pflav_072400 [Phytohabitans flavus]